MRPFWTLIWVTDMLLELNQVIANYDSGDDILRGVSLHIEAGELVCLVGPNGAGKSTVLRVISGILKPRKGSVVFCSEDVTGQRPDTILRKGICHVPQGRCVFPQMTVWENILMGAYTLTNRKLIKDRLETVCSLFPVLTERRNDRAGLLSGGQQKMVEMARALMLDPKLLLLDEPSLGLEPKSRAAVFERIIELNRAGKTVLLVEQNARSGLQIASRGCVMDLGQIRVEGTGPELLSNPEVRRLYVGER
ncbi:MAG: ABC transporter ATP-binding protein [Dehalococcoidia bacterium]